jgi:hypothetical protein
MFGFSLFAAAATVNILEQASRASSEISNRIDLMMILLSNKYEEKAIEAL